jgi:hypothetical protein
MRAHRHGADYGIPLSAIQQRKPVDIAWYNHHGPWKTDFRAVIADGRLLVQERIFKLVSKDS